MLNKNNRATYIFIYCIILPIALSIAAILMMHYKLLAEYHIIKPSIKFYYASLVQYFNLEYASYIYSIICIPCILLYVLADYFLYVDFDIKAFSRHIRGTKVASVNYLKFTTKTRNTKQLLLCGVPIPKELENLHILIAGSTGTGKSTILTELIASSIQRGDKVIIIDPNGGFLSKFYTEGDHILNPFDMRSEIWDTFFDIKNNSYDFEQIVYSMIPPQNSASGEEWNGYARTLLKGMMKACKKQGIYTIHHIIHMLNTASNQDIKAFVIGTEAESLFAGIDDGNSGALNSTKFVLAKHISAYQYLTPNNGFGFSLKNYINNGNGNLFITWKEDMLQALKPLISTWCDLISNAILSSSNTQNKLFVVDELGSLNQQPSLEQLATKGRKHGVNIVACIQSTSQLDDVYGKDKATSLRSCFRNLVVLGGSSTDEKTAEDLSSALGEHEVIRADNSYSHNQNTKKEQITKERIVLPSQIQSLPQLNGYLAFALNYPLVKFNIKRVEYPSIAVNFIQKIL
jgi:type IV secretory pathway TraG/TraD family ATPase VirD4